MIRKNHLGRMAAALAVFAVSPASANVIDVTYTGRIYSSYDLTGVFGIVDTAGFNNPALNLTDNYVPNAGGYVGYTFSANYVFDTTIGTLINSPTQDDIYGGADFGNSSPLIRATVTINGHTVSVSGSDNGEVWGESFGNNSARQYAMAQTYQPHSLNIYLQGFVYGHNGSLPLSVSPIDYTVGSGGPSDYGQGEYALIDSFTQQRTEILANITTLTVSDVPESSTWAMMLLGFAGISLLGYCRKSGPPLLPV